MEFEWNLQEVINVIQQKSHDLSNIPDTELKFDLVVVESR